MTPDCPASFEFKTILGSQSWSAGGYSQPELGHQRLLIDQMTEQIERKTWSRAVKLDDFPVSLDKATPETIEAHYLKFLRGQRHEWCAGTGEQAQRIREEILLAIDDLLIGLGMDPSVIDATQRMLMTTAISEVHTNSTVHAHRRNPERILITTVWFLCDVYNRIVMLLEVQDEGPGYSPETVEDPLAPANILQPTGHGALLCRELFDEMHVVPPGNKVQMIKVLTEL